MGSDVKKLSKKMAKNFDIFWRTAKFLFFIFLVKTKKGLGYFSCEPVFRTAKRSDARRRSYHYTRARAQFLIVFFKMAAKKNFFSQTNFFFLS